MAVKPVAKLNEILEEIQIVLAQELLDKPRQIHNISGEIEE